MRSGRTGLVAAGIFAALALLAVVVFVVMDDDGGGSGGPGAERSGDPAGDLAERFAAAWQAGDVHAVPFADPAGAGLAGTDVAAMLKLATAGLSTTDADRPVKVVVVKVRPASGSEATSTTTSDGAGPSSWDATASLRVTWKLDATRDWTYDTVARLQEGVRDRSTTTTAGVQPDGRWRVIWAPSVVHPRLAKDEALKSVRVSPQRGDILGPGGQPLVGERDVVEIGIQKSRSADPEGLARQVAAIVDVDPEALVARVKAAPPDQFVSVITLRRDAYLAIKDQIYPLPGTVFHDTTQILGPTKGFAQALLGRVGPATEEVAEASKGRVQVGDLTGLSGLQRAQDPVLAGTAGLTVQAVPKVGDPRPLKAYPATPGKPITITIDQRIQEAADAVMATAPKPAALVAIRPSTGDVLAVSNGPAEAAGYNRAMIGHYPPGSTFKVISGLTLLENGLTPDTPVNCPATITVGKVFRNAEGEVLGNVPFRDDFAHSCNTAFVGQSKTITAAQLADTARRLGYRDVDLGVPVFGGSVPTDGDATEHAADMIGQGKVETSPFAVALASASVAAGRSVQPRLLVDPTKPPTPGEALPAGPVEALRGLMRLVVTEGTGGALNGVPGGDVAGKTGTAEFGTESPPKTHAWFTGFQGDLAFAVLVEDGGFGGQVAAPLAADFLARLAG